MNGNTVSSREIKHFLLQSQFFHSFFLRSQKYANFAENLGTHYIINRIVKCRQDNH